MITGDTMINDIVYHKINLTGYYLSDACEKSFFNSGYQGAFRNDIENKKVWFVSAGDMAESLLYEFGLQIGDTLSPGILDPDNYWDFWIEDIDSVETSDGYRKLFLIRSMLNLSEAPFRIIEGIGGQNLISPIANWWNFELGYYLDCVSVNDSVYYNQTGNCEQIVGTRPALQMPAMAIFPNPSSGYIWIRNEADQNKPFGVEIFNSVGCRVKSITCDVSPTIIDLTNQPSGLFYIFVKTGSVTSGQKIILR